VDTSEARNSPRIEELFHAAADLSQDEQQVFLNGACEGDPKLRAAVARLLELQHLPKALPSIRAIDCEARQTAAEFLRDAQLHTFGPYRAVECIGLGGMGVVFKAIRDDDYKKTVAVKVLPSIGTETASQVDLFLRERQILAQLDHPNIARLLDGGTTPEHLLYLVMEYVEGLSLDRYADEKRLTTTQRLRLFLDVCDAVRHAHGNLIVHCDLKPSNILVNADGVPKLLDFGIARLLEDLEGGKNNTAVMTPAFASPEQVTGGKVTTSSDIYALGVMLYVLLTGRSPYAGATDPQSTVRAVCDRDLEFQSSDALAFDLRMIIAMATRKEPARRYSSVEQLSEDIRRFLDNRPVRARPDTVTYRASRFLRRNRLVVTVAALGLAGVMAGIGISVTESRRAQRRFDDLRHLAHFLIFEAYSGLEQLPGSTKLRLSVIAEAQRYLDELSRDKSVDPSLSLELAVSYIRLGGARGMPYGPNLGDTTGALLSLEKGRAILEKIAGKNPDDIEVQIKLCSTTEQLSTVLERLGRFEEAQAKLDRALTIVSGMQRRAPGNLRVRLLAGSVELSYSYLEALRAEKTRSIQGFGTALEHYHRALEQFAPLKETNEIAARDTATASFHISYVYWKMGDLTGNREDFERALEVQLQGTEITRTLAAKHPDEPKYLRSVADNLNEIGYTLTKLGRHSEAEAKFRESLARFEALATADPQNREAQKDVADVCRYFSACLVQSGRKTEGQALARRAIAIYDRIFAADPSNVEVQNARSEVNAVLHQD